MLHQTYWFRLCRLRFVASAWDAAVPARMVHIDSDANVSRIIRIAAVIARQHSSASAGRSPCFHMP
jgi:hypothetical protein